VGKAGSTLAELQSILTGAGHELRIAESPTSAIELGRNWVDVAVVDLGLESGPGIELGKNLQEHSGNCEVVLLTGNASVESAAAAVRAGAWAYLTKPCKMSDILAAIDTAARHVKTLAEKRDLARRTHIAEKLAAVGTLTAGLSHEIRNPLNGAVLQLAVLERQIRKLEASQQLPLLKPLTVVRDEIRRLEHILQDFLQFARPAPLSISVTNLSRLLETLVEFLEVDARKRHIRLRCAAHVIPEIHADADKLKQVFMNLTLNALDAAGGHGEVVLSCEADPDSKERVIAHVDDSGKGIAPDAAARIFEPFFTTKPGGSGLGLSLSNAIISLHGGQILIGTSPQGGARFSVVLPIK
jgi:signal transduction histidine kinase